MKLRSVLCPVLSLILWLNLPVTAFSSPSMSLNSGINLFYGPLDIRAYQKTKSISFDKIPDISDFSDFASLFQKPVWSITADSSKYKKTPVSFKFQIGDLSYSGAVSHLRNPAFSTNFSFFAQTPQLSNDLGISVPQAESSSKTKSASLQIKNKYGKFSFSCDFEGYIKSCISLNLRPADFFKLSILFCLADFSFTQKTQSSWRLSEPDFISDRKNACYFEFLFSIPLFKLKIDCGATENPYNTLRFYSAAELLFHYGIFSVAVCAFTNDSVFMNDATNAFSISQTKNSVLYETKFSPSFDFSIKNISFKTGISALYISSIPENNVKNEKLYLAAGFSVFSQKDRFSLQYKLQNLDIYYFSPKYASLTFSEDEKLKHSLTIRYTHKFTPLSLSVTARSTAEPKRFLENSIYTQALTFSVCFRHFFIKSASVSAELEEKKSSLKTRFNGSISAEYSAKNLKITGKFGLSESIVVE